MACDKVRLLLDTDIGSDIDDAVALAATRGAEMAKACAIGGSSRIWTLTEKAAQKMQDAERGHRAGR